MGKGGHRQNAGRKKGIPNLLTQELRQKINAEGLISFLQRLADGKVKGASISERKEAAIALLKKILPDCKHTEIEQIGEQVQSDEAFRKRQEEIGAFMKKLDPETRKKVLDAAKASVNE